MEVSLFSENIHRIGSERREIFGSELKNSVAPGPGVYDLVKGVSFVKGKNTPSITIASKFGHIMNPETSPGPGQYDAISLNSLS